MRKMNLRPRLVNLALVLAELGAVPPFVYAQSRFEPYGARPHRLLKNLAWAGCVSDPSLTIEHGVIIRGELDMPRVAAIVNGVPEIKIRPENIITYDVAKNVLGSGRQHVTFREVRERVLRDRSKGFMAK